MLILTVFLGFALTDAALSFLGTILVALITLIGVMFNTVYTRKISEENKKTHGVNSGKLDTVISLFKSYDKAQRLRFRVSVAHDEVAFFEADSEGNYLWANRSLLNLTELSLPDALGLGWVQAINPADRDMVVKVWNRDVASLSSFGPYDFRYRDTWVRVEAIPVKFNLDDGDDDGDVLGAEYVGTAIPLHGEPLLNIHQALSPKA